MKEIRLTEEDIKLIKSEKRIGFVFSVFILFAGVLFSLTYFFTDGIDHVFIITDCLIIIFSFLVPFLMNKKYNVDLKKGIKIIKEGTIQQIESVISYEAGSGNLYTPLIGDLFPKLWGSHPKKSNIYYLIINYIRYESTDVIFDKAETGDNIEMYYTPCSDILLGFGEIINNENS